MHIKYFNPFANDVDSSILMLKLQGKRFVLSSKMNGENDFVQYLVRLSQDRSTVDSVFENLYFDPPPLVCYTLYLSNKAKTFLISDQTLRGEWTLYETSMFITDLLHSGFPATDIKEIKDFDKELERFDLKFIEE